MSEFLNELNEAQRAAVVNTEGPSLVIAGAGSGKTRVLTYRIAWLLSQGVSPSNILALTFTNKAAREMKERIARLVGDKYARYLWMGTFHSVFSKILRQESARIDYGHDYTIYDSTDSKSVIKQIVKEMGLDEKQYKPGMIASRISMAKNNLLSPVDYAGNRALIEDDKRARLYRMQDIYFAYNKRLKQANAMDFDDLLFNMNLLLEQNEDLREKYSSIFRYILVDEYQDTNYCQSRIVKQLAEPLNNICVVGDDAQSIYSFRGANIDNILGFRNMFGGAQLFKLERNYRSTQNIVDAANSLIKKNEGQIRKNVYSEKEAGERLHVSAHENDRHEGEFIAKTIQQGKRSGKAQYDGFAVLYRTNAQSRVIEDELRKLGIPYRIYGSVSFYQRKEIKDAIAYFRLVVNPSDDEALLRVINFPARGIGETTMRRVLDTAHRADVPAFAVVSDPQRYALESAAAAQKKLTGFAALINSFREQAQTEDAYVFAQNVLKQTAVMSAALADKSAEGQDRYDNLQELLGSIHEFSDARRQQGEETKITDFLAEVSLLTDQDEHLDDETPRVSLMTIHAAKGLEFPVVIIAGLEEQLFPSAFAESVREIEEERRLFYVAITRAERECYITYARQRFRNGQIVFSSPSRFLKDIDEQYLDRSGEKRTIVQPQWQPSWLQSEWRREPEERPMPAATRKLSKTTGMQPSADKKPIETAFAAGSRVRHATFGDGTVRETFEENGNEKIVVRFDTKGEKTLLLKFAKLERL
ncbi:MAG: UvrD-helicase domain-containing protein [Paludibacteraceae bacterium]|nr:UvrD-helicase domain-containing protein [Paludibacteraceae bacterium]